MSLSMRLLNCLAPLLMMALLYGCVTFGTDSPCKKETLAHLDQLNVPTDKVRKIHIRSNTTRSRSSTRVLGHSAWVSLKGCSGSLVVEMHRYCDFRRAYTTRDCSVQNVPAA